MATLCLSVLQDTPSSFPSVDGTCRHRMEKRGPPKGQGQSCKKLFSGILPQSPQGLGKALANGAQEVAGKVVLQIPLNPLHLPFLLFVL